MSPFILSIKKVGMRAWPLTHTSSAAGGNSSISKGHLYLLQEESHWETAVSPPAMDQHQIGLSPCVVMAVPRSGNSAQEGWS